MSKIENSGSINKTSAKQYENMKDWDDKCQLSEDNVQKWNIPWFRRDACCHLIPEVQNCVYNNQAHERILALSATRNTCELPSMRYKLCSMERERRMQVAARRSSYLEQGM